MAGSRAARPEGGGGALPRPLPSESLPPREPPILTEIGWLAWRAVEELLGACGGPLGDRSARSARAKARPRTRSL